MYLAIVFYIIILFIMLLGVFIILHNITDFYLIFLK